MTTLKVLCVFGVPHLVVLRHLVSSDASCEMRKKIIDPLSVVRINLNHGDIARYLSKEPSLLTELVLLQINTNRFCGTVPHKFDKLKLLFELDLSNNCFVEKFLDVVLCLSQLKFLDLRFNKFKVMDMDFEHKHDQNPVHSVEDNGVDYLLEREERNWDANLKWEDILSLGEQQRLGMIYAEDAGFDDVIAEDRTNQSELDALENKKDDFIGDFSKVGLLLSHYDFKIVL
ncbi:Leucine-rich repeat extensin-like protein 3 [Glycine soja]|uniref:Leucine-rich repeat extensin-like protein 3 n=1 Tax=Glycine soja TaxID=3848 RepID=A0A0B2PJE2_GLYSO|nr:hypothetical protein JHK87_050453 [Glycine soja]KHN07829.1 Leucine-rich repeat extensin-like protein 3 [Glycine soja]